MLHRARMLSVAGLVLAGAGCLIASTQTWLTATRVDGGTAIEVAGAAASPLLAPLGLAVLALGAVLALSGRILRYLVGAAALLIAVAIGSSTLALLRELPISAVLPTVAEITGLAGPAASAMISGITPSGWPWAVVLASCVLLLAALLILATAHSWRSGGRRYQSAPPRPGAPVDAIDSWDELSRGVDPTQSGR